MITLSDLFKSEKQIRIEKSISMRRTIPILDNALKTLLSDGDPINKGNILASYLKYQSAAGFKDEADVTRMLTAVYLKGAEDQLSELRKSKSRGNRFKNFSPQERIVLETALKALTKTEVN